MAPVFFCRLYHNAQTAHSQKCYNYVIFSMNNKHKHRNESVSLTNSINSFLLQCTSVQLKLKYVLFCVDLCRLRANTDVSIAVYAHVCRIEAVCAPPLYVNLKHAHIKLFFHLIYHVALMLLSNQFKYMKSTNQACYDMTAN